MKSIKFESISIEGFGRFVRPVVFKLDRPGINLIYGDNGEGKTTLFSALTWCLFKLNLKGVANDKVASWEHLRPDSWRGTRVAITMKVEGEPYLIARHHKFTGQTKELRGSDKLMIFTNEGLMGDEQHKGDMESFIERELLGMSETIFTNAVLFGQRMKRLVEASNDEKRELLEQTFETEWISQAKERVSVEVGIVTEELRKLDKNISLVSQDRERQQAEITKAEKILNEFENTRSTDLADKEEALAKVISSKKVFVDDIEKLEEKAKEATASTDDLEDIIKAFKENLKVYTNEKQNQEDAVKEYKAGQRDSEKKIQQYKTEKETTKDHCLTCKQKLKDVKLSVIYEALDANISKEEQVIKVLGAKILELERAVRINSELITEKEAKIKTEETKVETIKRDNKAIRDVETSLVQKRTSLSYTEENITNLKEDIKKIRDRKPPKLGVEEMKIELEKFESKVLEFESIKETKLSYHKQLLFWDTKGFAANGLKAYIFKAMLENLNAATQQYASRLGTYVKFSIDTTKIKNNFVTTCIKREHITYDDGTSEDRNIEAEYKELSGGEKQRVDICLAFGFDDMVKFKVDCNLLIMDEIFENLDAKGVEIVFDLIRMKAIKDKSIYAITHLVQLDTLNAKSITIRQENNSSIIEA